MIGIRQKGDFSKITHYFEKVGKHGKTINLDKYGHDGVAALSAATPVDTGLTASSWYYVIEQTSGRVSIKFCNSNIQNGVPIAIILQYGHGTRHGGWVEGQDYINPALKPIFDKIADSAWREVTSL